ncbi:MAG: Gfo/Idh/MocA family oxidoreductase [Bacteroidales bacterium]|nr:Gfo/Idh/MocA family oxidoreductase [Bacteroidales bacterium]
MKIGIIGYGSIGSRHAGNLIGLGYSDITLLRTRGRGNSHGLREVYDYDEFLSGQYDCVIVCNPTSLHFDTITPLIRENINVLVEKPLVCLPDELESLRRMLAGYKGLGMVAYNMRFHPCIRRIKEIISAGTIGSPLSARLAVGQYLPDWRPSQDYRTGVSALRSLGGGVVLELIHEIDMAIHLFGPPSSDIHSVAMRASSLEIETEDISEILYVAAGNTLISIHQDYLNRTYRRTIEIMGSEATLDCDLKSASIKITAPGDKPISEEVIPFERNDMYVSLIDYYTTCIRSGTQPEPSLTEGLVSVSAALIVKQQNNL